jgi:dTDP-4-amino-4,6-dideoxygalactose transaminase
MTTGEGGMVTTNNRQIAEKIKLLREHGSRTRYHHNILGYNFRMTSIAAAMGITQLKKLEKFNRLRIRNAEYLSKKLAGISGIITPQVREGCRHVFHQYTVRITSEFGKSRNEVAEVLKKNGIGCGIYYPLPIHQQKLYRRLGYRVRLPVAEKMSKQVLSLPIHPRVTRRDLDKIAAVFMK